MSTPRQVTLDMPGIHPVRARAEAGGRSVRTGRDALWARLSAMGESGR